MSKFSFEQRVIVNEHGAGIIIEVEEHDGFTSYAIDFDDGSGFWCAEWEIEAE